MKNALSAKYAKAFIQALGKEKCQEFLQKREILELVFANQQFLSILHHPFVSGERKVECILDMLKIQDLESKNALKVLAQAKRLELLPSILQEISNSLQEQRSYHATLYTQEKVSAQYLEGLKERLFKKLGLQIEINEKLWEKEGAKCTIDELDLEIAFSKDAFVHNLEKYILDTFRKGV